MSHQPPIGGYGRLRPGLPQYAQVQQHSHESNNSDQSIQTQIPAPFHSSPGLQHFGFGGQFGPNGNFNGLQSPGISNGFNSMALNPNSPSYIPAGAYPGGLNVGSFAVPGGVPNGYVGVIGQGQFADFGQNGGDAQMSGYGNANHYPSGLQYAGSDAGGVGPYSHFGSEFGGNGYGNGGGIGMQQYQMSGAPSPIMSFASMSTTNRGYGTSYGNPSFQGAARYGHQGQTSGMPGAVHNPSGWNNMQHQQNYPVQPPQPSNVNRGKNSYQQRRNNQYGGPPSNFGAPPSSLATAPVWNANRQSYGQHINRLQYNSQQNMSNPQHFDTPIVGDQTSGGQPGPIGSRIPGAQVGGPVRPQSQVSHHPHVTQPKSNVESNGSQSMQESEAESSPVPISISDDEVEITEGNGPTPHGKALVEKPFLSDRKGVQTPCLRTRRNQSITCATDPARKQATVSWLEGVPIGAAESGGTQTTPPPPKMNLGSGVLNSGNSGMVGATPLRPINETDPFGASPAPSMVNNMFGPMTHAPVFKGGNNFVGRPGPQGGGISPQLMNLVTGPDGSATRPTLEQALSLQNLPFAEYCRLSRPCEDFGVIRIKNIPYSVNRPEVLAFLGRNARIISEADYEPVHIVMERVTSKTLDCYVEFVSLHEAVTAVNRFETNRTGGRGGRLGQRHVEVELSSQEALMQDLFPKAKNVSWNGTLPIIHERDPADKYNSGFQGFISKEELVMLVKHVEAPQRSPFSKDCPQRPFECLISTLIKYPWYMVDFITIEDRNLLHKATLELIRLLRDRLENNEVDVNITPMLYKRVWRAAMKCSGFSPTMKDDVAYMISIDSNMCYELGLPPFPDHWKELWTIGMKPGAPYDLVLYYCAIMREITTVEKQELTLAEKAVQGFPNGEVRLFGRLKELISLPKRQESFIHMTLAQVAEMEWAGIERALRQALTPMLQ